MRKLLWLLCCISLSGAVQAAAYRWVDDDGVTVYSQTPPADGRRSEVTPLPGTSPPRAPSQQPDTQLQEIEQYLEDQQEDRKLAKERSEKEQQEAAVNSHNCEVAKNNLKNLESLGRRLLKTETGEYKRLTEEERQALMQEARDQIQLYCK